MNILWIPHVTWSSPQRARLFCEKLSDRHRVHVTDIYGFRCLSDYLSKKYLKNYFYWKYMDHEITVHHIPRISPVLPFRGLRRVNSDIFSRYVDRIIRAERIDVVVGTFVCKPPRAKRLVFDLFDDNPAYWREYGRIKNYADEIETIEREYLDKADEIVAASSVLAEKVQQKKVHLIPNGVDLEKFKNADGEKVRDALDLRGVVVGFVSAFGEFSGLMRLVKSSELIREDLTFLIVGSGPLLNGAKNYVKRKNIENFVFTGHVDFNAVHDYFKAIDIGVLPFDKIRFTDSACPIKLLEYTAAGKPVVSTNLEEVKRMNFSNVVLVKDDAVALAEGIKRALNSKLKIPKKIKEYDIKRLANKYEAVLKY
jgi:glycosyltransferase involved in cell wall biosynthesis